MNYPTETEHEAMGQRQRSEDHGKVIFASIFFIYLFYFCFAAILGWNQRKLTANNGQASGFRGKIMLN